MSELPLTGGFGEKKWTLADGIAEIKREMAMRDRVYPAFVARGHMTQQQADQHNRALAGALRFLEFCLHREVQLREFLSHASTKTTAEVYERAGR